MKPTINIIITIISTSVIFGCGYDPLYEQNTTQQCRLVDLDHDGIPEIDHFPPTLDDFIQIDPSTTIGSNPCDDNFGATVNMGVTSALEYRIRTGDVCNAVWYDRICTITVGGSNQPGVSVRGEYRIKHNATSGDLLTMPPPTVFKGTRYGTSRLLPNSQTDFTHIDPTQSAIIIWDGYISYTIQCSTPYNHDKGFLIPGSAPYIRTERNVLFSSIEITAQPIP